MDRAASGRKPDGKSGIWEVKVERRPKVCYTPKEWEYVKGMAFQKKRTGVEDEGRKRRIF